MEIEKPLSLREEMAEILERQGRSLPAKDEMYQKPERRVYRERPQRNKAVPDEPAVPITPPWLRR